MRIIVKLCPVNDRADPISSIVKIQR